MRRILGVECLSAHALVVFSVSRHEESAVRSYLEQVGNAEDRRSRKGIDVAIGILVGLRGCAPDEAFAELAQVVRRSGIGLSATSAALVELATGRSGSSPEHAEAFNAWGTLLAGRRSVATAAL
jgi:hypothetical protein